MLKIAVVAYNIEQSQIAIKILAENDNSSKPKLLCLNETHMEDGTIYQIMSFSKSMRGEKFDQLIIINDFRFNVYNQFPLEIYELKERIKFYSCVPEEFQVQEYQLD
jgi:hypothetical protein